MCCKGFSFSLLAGYITQRLGSLHSPTPVYKLNQCHAEWGESIALHGDLTHLSRQLQFLYQNPIETVTLSNYCNGSSLTWLTLTLLTLSCYPIGILIGFNVSNSAQVKHFFGRSAWRQLVDGGRTPLALKEGERERSRYCV